MAIYFDNNATTPVDSDVIDEMMPFLSENFGNASSVHFHGQRARRAIDIARQRVAELIGADPSQIFFTSGGTEADNWALYGRLMPGAFKQQIVVSSVEHPAIFDTAFELGEQGIRVDTIPVDESGRVIPEVVDGLMTEDTRIVSVMLANNDVGTIQPVGEIAEIVHENGGCLHTDAVQAVGKISFDVNELGVDLLSMSAHKLYGPKGIGALWIRPGVFLRPMLRGGHQESRRRAGTENVPAVVGFGAACAIAKRRLAEDARKVALLRNHFEEIVTQKIEGVKINGCVDCRLPGTSSMSFSGTQGESLMMALDLEGVCVSVGSACTASVRGPSHVLEAMGVPAKLARGTLRFSFGRNNTRSEVDEAVRALVGVLGRVREHADVRI